VLAKPIDPSMRQQFTEPFDRIVGDAAEHIPEPSKRIDLRQFAGCDKAAQNCRRLPAVIVAEKIPVVPSDREARSDSQCRCCRKADLRRRNNV
jgi:hypothetical protein